MPKAKAKPASKASLNDRVREALRTYQVVPQSTAVGSIHAAPDLQVRASLDDETVEEYAQELRNDPAFEFPPAVLFYDGEKHWLADGYHRYAAYRKAGRTHVAAVTVPGTRRDALQYALSANYRHGLRRNNEDKRRAVELALADEEWGKWSDSEVGRLCAVSHPFVASVRASLETVSSEAAPAPAERTYTTKHGTTAKMKTERIGRKRAEGGAAAQAPGQPEPVSVPVHADEVRGEAPPAAPPQAVRPAPAGAPYIPPPHRYHFLFGLESILDRGPVPPEGSPADERAFLEQQTRGWGQRRTKMAAALKALQGLCDRWAKILAEATD
jgi:hypothetical protein